MQSQSSVQRKLQCPGFQDEVVLMDADLPRVASISQEATVNENAGVSVPKVYHGKTEHDTSDSIKVDNSSKDKSQDNEDFFSDSEVEDNEITPTNMVQKGKKQPTLLNCLKKSVAEKNNMAIISNFDSVCQMSSKYEDSKINTIKAKDHTMDKKCSSSGDKAGEQSNSKKCRTDA